MKIPNDPFKLELLRDLRASKSNLKLFKNLYKANLPEISNKNTGRLWDKLNIENQRNLDKSPIFVNKLKTILEIISNEEGRILDIGIGIGALESLLIANNSKFQMYGTDISTKSLNFIKKKMKKIVVKKSNLSKIPFPRNFFDTVLILDVLEHISPSKVMNVYKEIGRILKKGGKLIVSVPLNEDLENMINHGQNPNAHVRVYTLNILNAELKLSGFKVLNIYELFAFNTMYYLKTFLVTKIIRGFRKPNLALVVAKKI